MKVFHDIDDHIISAERSSNWGILYCSHIWTNSHVRRGFIGVPQDGTIKYCYTCKGKIRRYELKSFEPNNHSTPNRGAVCEDDQSLLNVKRNQVNNSDSNSSLENYRQIIENDIENNECIPSISSQIDSTICSKYISHEVHANENNQRRLRKSLKRIGCVVNFALTDSPVKKRTQIQACSISVMIIAIVAISFILVNFTSPSFTRASNVASTIVVPIKQESNETHSTLSNDIYPDFITELNTTEVTITTESHTVENYTDNNTLLFDIISKIRKNIRTYPKESLKVYTSNKPKDIINRDLSQKFCSCQTNEVCMLNENSGTAICRKTIDNDDPTGCGGLCALETEACQLVDKARGVRVCRLLSPVTCSSQEWRCRNGLCVPTQTRCDGHIQCYDRSDEMQCECDLSKQFRCGHSISCFSKTKLCDGVIDCWDGFDEVNCTVECPDDQFTCTDGQCILSSRFCDGLADCADGSDEPHGCDDACGDHELRCQNRRCVPRAVLCDGYDNCGDATDERHC